MILKGAKINFLGDSITEGVGTTVQDCFCTQIGEKYGAICRNYGISGTRIARQQVPANPPSTFDLDFCMRSLEMDEDADVVVVFGGTNDYGHGDAPFGTFEDRTVDTYCGGLHVLYQRLLERYPRSLIVILTPLHRWGERQPRFDGHILDDFVQMTRKVAEYYSLPVLDLYAMSGMQPELEGVRNQYVPDGLHPNTEGHKILTELIAKFLEQAGEKRRL
ncbi:MAG: SGNH/GDSL hydrolase family protein [Clostridiales bacterium]|nr:SGNH/GDSL hydrolase family protein [Clostridiales bacterium]